MVQGNALKIQVAYLVVDIVNIGSILTCDVVAMIDYARSLSMVVVSLIIFASECSSIVVSLGWRTSSCGSPSVVEVGSCVTTPVPMHCVLFLGRLVLPMVGSCVTTLGLP